LQSADSRNFSFSLSPLAAGRTRLHPSESPNRTNTHDLENVGLAPRFGAT
jgi:hypothetical protein